VFDYDLLVIGCGPGGQKAAIAAAKLGKRAAVVEGALMVGGACLNTGTIPSKTLRETVLT
jgi:NAD(P) transhydrogenase